MSRLGRGLAQLALLAVAASVLAACSTGAARPLAEKPSHSSRVPRPAVTPGPLPCPTFSLSLFGGRRAADSAGDAQGTVVVTNTSSTACRLDAGTPTVALLGTEGVLTVEQAAGGPALTPTVLDPGATATLVLQWSNWCAGDPGTVQIVLSWPDGSSAHGPFDGPPGGQYVPSCVSNGQPSTISVEQGYQPGSP